MCDLNRLKKQLGDNLKNYRQQRNLTQEELAEILKCSEKYIGHIEQGRKCPSVLFLKKVSIVLEISMDKLFKNT